MGMEMRVKAMSCPNQSKTRQRGKEERRKGGKEKRRKGTTDKY